MNKFLLSAILAVNTLLAIGQIEQGKFFLIGRVGFARNLDVNSFLSQPGIPPELNQTSINGSIAFNYMVFERWSIGPLVSLDFTSASYSEVISANGGNFIYSGIYKGNDHRINVGVNIRHFIPISDKLFMFVSAQGGLILIKQELEYRNDPSNIDNGRGYAVSIEPSLAYAFNERWVVNLTMGIIQYEKIHPKDFPQFYVSDLSANFDLSSFKLGAQIHLGRMADKIKKPRKSKEQFVPLFPESLN